ncbi:MAG: T9SS type A sorting domain-containing protein [Ignavibacteriales bacterium]|nr:T9SS type A sorting domain-containing protein [Ignavibacteriales bacterium]
MNIQVSHSYTDFIDSVKGNLVYSKPGQDTVTESVPIPFISSLTYGTTITAKDSLIRSGYRLHFHFTIVDKCLIPNTFRLPTTGGYEIRLIIPQSDWYNKLPDFRNIYQRSIVSGSDTIVTGEVSHKFLMDTVINSTNYKREELFGEMLYFIPGDSNYSAVFYKSVSGVMQEAGRDSLFFSVTYPTPIHYFVSGGKVGYLSDKMDSTGGFISRIYHLKGGQNDDEELKYKVRTGPVLLVGYEPDGTGGSQKVIYRLTKVNNQGIITSYDGDEDKLTGVDLPTEFSISNNYPNPFNPSTKVRIATVENSVLTFTLFNSNGEEVSSFTKEYAAKGNYEQEINLSGLPSGAWFLSVKDDNGRPLKLLKLLYLK